MCCGLDLIVCDTWEEFLAMEEDLAICRALHVNNFHSAEEFHAAAREPLEAGLSPDDNYHRDELRKQTFSLWYHLERTHQKEVNHEWATLILSLPFRFQSPLRELFTLVISSPAITTLWSSLPSCGTTPTSRIPSTS